MIGAKSNNIYLLQLGCNPVAVVNLHVYKTRNWLLLKSVPSVRMLPPQGVLADYLYNSLRINSVV